MASELVDQTTLLTALASHAIDRIQNVGENFLQEYWTKHRGRDLRTYVAYLARKRVKAAFVRNFLFSTSNSSLDDIYIPTIISEDFRNGNELLQALCSPNEKNGQAVSSVAQSTKAEKIPDRPTRALGIVGKAGAGKSLFLKHAFFEIQRIDSKRIPLLLEARAFNRAPISDLEARIFDDIASLDIQVTPEQIKYGLRSGLFVILLDGVDELKGKIQSHYYEEIDSFIAKYPLCPILLSGRPTQQLYSLPITVREIAPLTRDAAIEMLEKVQYDSAIKRAFIDLVMEKLYTSHYHFVSNPLLCLVMLVTYSDCGRISNSQHEFYEDAFVALWSKHDNRKGGFERDRISNLQKVEFLKLLSAFALSSYNDGDYEMRDAQFNKHFKMAKQLTGISCGGSEFQQDLVVSTCLMVEDGPYIRFFHRSFQEYFAAIFLAEADESIVGELAEELSDRLETDSVLPFVLSMNSEKIETNWVLPMVRRILASVPSLDDDILGYSTMTVARPGEMADSMRKIRLLYRFRPTTAELQAAHDAGQDMGTLATDLRKTSSSVRRMFLKDRSNIIDLSKRLEKKSQEKTSALKLLLRTSNE
jgi:hypothetical protein